MGGGGLAGLLIWSQITGGGGGPTTGSATASIGLINEFLVASLFKGNSQRGDVLPYMA